MGKTGTTNNFRDALFVGSTYGPEGVTIAVRIGFDDNGSLGPRETGARFALPVFKAIMLGVYRQKLAGPVPEFPPEMEQRISLYLNPGPVVTAAVTGASVTRAPSPCIQREREIPDRPPSRALTNDDLSQERILVACTP